MTISVEMYRTHSAWTDPGAFTSRVREIPPDPAAVARGVSGLLLHPMFMRSASGGARPPGPR